MEEQFFNFSKTSDFRDEADEDQQRKSKDKSLIFVTEQFKRLIFVTEQSKSLIFVTEQSKSLIFVTEQSKGLIYNVVDDEKFVYIFSTDSVDVIWRIKAI
jgi:hypothetical protein